MRRPRPVAGTDLRVVAADLGGSSFPSGHVLTYTVVYGWLAVLADLLIRPDRPRRLVVGALAALVAGVGPSRIHLGHHWPTDVTASYLLGSSYLATLVLLYRRLKSRPIDPMTDPTTAGASGCSGTPAPGSKAGLPTNGTSEEALRDLMTRHGLGDELIATESEEQAIDAGARRGPGRATTSWWARAVTARSASWAASCWAPTPRWGCCRWARS